jgi:hypothetical protein
MDLDFTDFRPPSTCLPVAMHTFNWNVGCIDDGCEIEEFSDMVKFSNGVVGRMHLWDSCENFADGVNDSIQVVFDILACLGPQGQQSVDDMDDYAPFFGHMRIHILDVDGNVVGVISSPEQSDVMKLPERLDDNMLQAPTFRASDEVIERAKIFHTAHHTQPDRCTACNYAFATDRTHWSLRLRATIWLYDAGEVMGV